MDGVWFGCACHFLWVTAFPVLVPVNLVSAPSLQSWRLHTVDLGSVVKFDQKVFLVLGGSGRCDAGCPVCRDSVEHARLFEDLPTMLSVYFDVALARRLLCCFTLATSSLRTRSSKPAGEGTVPVHVPPEVVTQLLDVFQGLGVSQHVL